MQYIINPNKISREISINPKLMARAESKDPRAQFEAAQEMLKQGHVFFALAWFIEANNNGASKAQKFIDLIIADAGHIMDTI